MPETLTNEQKKFLLECEKEFSDRFTENDAEFKKIYDAGIPSPPIVCPWTISRRGPRGSGRWQQSSGSRSHSNNRQEYRSRSYGNREREGRYGEYDDRRRY